MFAYARRATAALSRASVAAGIHPTYIDNSSRKIEEIEMVKVHVWDFRGSTKGWGHASMEVGSTYISWWPRPEGTKTGLRLLPQIYAAHPWRDQRFEDDKEYEGRGPDQTVNLNGLNERAIKDWWQSFGLMRDRVAYEGPMQAWQTLKMNCSTVVATGLTKGGGRACGYTKPLQSIWRPSDVLAYALAIRAAGGPAGSAK
ncbi:hypothetical protein ACV22V_30490 [Burkholderia sp. AW33-5]